MIDLMRRQQAAMGSRQRRAPFAAGLMASRRRRKQAKLVLIAAIAAVAVAYALFPIYWVFTASVDPLNTLSSQRFLPRSVSLRNYAELLDDPANPFGLGSGARGPDGRRRDVQRQSGGLRQTLRGPRGPTSAPTLSAASAASNAPAAAR